MAKADKRHIVKSITWRIIGTLDTILLSWLLTGSAVTGLQIGCIEVVTKMFLYYFHERIWYNVEAGLEENGDSRKRHIIKTITWRLIGTLDTMLIASVISGNPIIGLKIGGAELITKMLLYYFHERIWYRFDFGLKNRRVL